MNWPVLTASLLLVGGVHAVAAAGLDDALRTEPVTDILANRSIARELGRKCPDVRFPESVNSAVADLENTRTAEWLEVTSLSVMLPALELSDAFDARYGTTFNMAATPFARIDASICPFAVREARSNRLLGLMLLP